MSGKFQNFKDTDIATKYFNSYGFFVANETVVGYIDNCFIVSKSYTTATYLSLLADDHLVFIELMQEFSSEYVKSRFINQYSINNITEYLEALEDTKNLITTYISLHES